MITRVRSAFLTSVCACILGKPLEAVSYTHLDVYKRQVASSMLWLWILNPQYGLLNNSLQKLGLYQPNWLTDPRFTKPALLIMGDVYKRQAQKPFKAAVVQVDHI